MSPDEIEELYDYETIARKLDSLFGIDTSRSILDQTKQVVENMDGYLDMRFDRDGLRVLYIEGDEIVCEGFHGEDPNKSLLLAIGRAFDIVPKRGE